MPHFKPSFCYLIFILVLCSPLQHFADVHSTGLESYINEQMGSYPFTQDNRFKLAVYSELKGKYQVQINAFTLDFGKLGSLAFYADHCLLKTRNHRVFVLKKYALEMVHAGIVNHELNQLFEQITLMGNHGANQAHITFVNAALARKNLDPFDKIYTRHILLRYGKYDPIRASVRFHTDWLDQLYTDDETGSSASIVRRHANPLLLELNQEGLRGYYIKVKGEVYVRDVDRTVPYATGETYSYNIGAFKLFIQKLFIQSVQYLPDPHMNPNPRKGPGGNSNPAGPKPLYTQYNWIPMMLTILRNRKINIGDPDVICYFIDQPYYSRIYKQMTAKERAAANRYRKTRIPSLTLQASGEGPPVSQ